MHLIILLADTAFVFPMWEVTRAAREGRHESEEARSLEACFAR